MKIDFSVFGYFDNPGDKTPTHDPGPIPCPVCDKAIAPADCVTVSFIPERGTRSYFYRIHRACNTEKAVMEVESFIVDAMNRLSEAQEAK